jgi:hypothetical protein
MLGAVEKGQQRILAKSHPHNHHPAILIPLATLISCGTAMYRLQFLGHRVEPYAALATG